MRVELSTKQLDTFHIFLKKSEKLISSGPNKSSRSECFLKKAGQVRGTFWERRVIYSTLLTRNLNKMSILSIKTGYKAIVFSFIFCHLFLYT